ncbi:MAG: hypothetical protein KME07_08875 [Pegethrix bostrychoides GSE-TBD4-15B]|uniref:Effector-associated domain-containing protein n=1 Tax=Pegethrix bostrychoides GSE-TBD4-15B TaxID=2839662 RepID=A0A951U4D7_9CYAN|nr:hypothetical protein [Pegethrix bostrychoides GSE-TBD4-15B]
MNEIFKVVRELIQENDMQLASKILLEVAEQNSSRFHNEIIGHRASLRQIANDERKGIATDESIRKQKKRIRYALLEVTDEIDKELSSAGKRRSLNKSSNLSKGVVFEGTVSQVIVQQTEKGLNFVMNKEKIIEISGNTGNVSISAPLVIADTIENSFNALAKSDFTEDKVKTLLEQLLKDINELNKVVPQGQAKLGEKLARDAETLVKEATSSEPRREWYELSVKGLKDAASSIGEIATPVLETVNKLVKLLLI